MLAALKEEEEQRSQMTRDKMEKLAGDLRSLTDDIQLMEEQLAADDITFLQVSVRHEAGQPLRGHGQAQRGLVHRSELLFMFLLISLYVFTTSAGQTAPFISLPFCRTSRQPSNGMC